MVHHRHGQDQGGGTVARSYSTGLPAPRKARPEYTNGQIRMAGSIHGGRPGDEHALVVTTIHSPDVTITLTVRAVQIGDASITDPPWLAGRQWRRQTNCS